MLEAPSEPKKYTTEYRDFKGVDFTTEPSSVWKRRSPIVNYFLHRLN